MPCVALRMMLIACCLLGCVTNNSRSDCLEYKAVRVPHTHGTLSSLIEEEAREGAGDGWILFESFFYPGKDHKADSAMLIFRRHGKQ